MVLRFMLRSCASRSERMPDRLRDPAAEGGRGEKAHGRSASDVGPGPGVIRVGH